jgi:hypothetical protein
VGRLYIRKKYLGIKGNVYELLWDILAFLLGKSKNLKKELINSSFPTGIVKEEGRDKRKFRIFGTENCPFPLKIFIFSVIISFISNSSTFWSSRAPKICRFFF